MRMNRVFPMFILMISIIWSCGDDDPLIPGEVVPPRLLSEVAIEDDAAIQEYLQTHFYNYEEFANPPAGFDFKIKIDTIAGENADKTPMINMDELTSETILINASIFGLEEEENIPHIIYYLEAREGSGGIPTIGDNTILRYDGFFFDGALFDSSTNAPISFYLPMLIQGFGRGMTKFKSGEQLTENPDGTVTFDNYGVGLIIMPSGLAYANGRGPNNDIPPYSPLIFAVDNLLFEEDTDFDGDGIPSILEDVNMDGNLNNDNTDGDFTMFGPLSNHLDPDDDNDGIPTREEIELDDEGNFVGFRDTDGDGIDDHLDDDS